MREARLRRYRHIGAGETDAHMFYICARREKADQLGERRRAKAALGYRIPERGDQCAVIKGGEQNVFVACGGTELETQSGNPGRKMCRGRLGHVLRRADIGAFEKFSTRLRREPAI